MRERKNIKTKSTVKTIEALEARVRFGAVMAEVEKTDTRFLVSKRGKPNRYFSAICCERKQVVP